MRSLGILTSILACLAVVSSVPLGAESPGVATAAGGDLCTGGQASGTGLRGAYYSADPRVSKPSFVRIDPRIDSDAVRTLPRQSSEQPLRSVRWCGWIRPIMSGPHRLQSAAKVMRVEIGKQAIAGPGVAAGASIELEAGKAYSILIELPDATGAGQFSLQWTPPFGATYDIPPTVLFPPVETVEPGC